MNVKDGAILALEKAIGQTDMTAVYEQQSNGKFHGSAVIDHCFDLQFIVALNTLVQYVITTIYHWETVVKYTVNSGIICDYTEKVDIS